MGNDMFNDEQLAHAEIVQKETEDALGWWKDRALKAEAALSALSRARETEDGAVREAADHLIGLTLEFCNGDCEDPEHAAARALRTALSSPPRPDFIRCALPRGECCHQRIPPVLPLEAPECNDGDDCCRYCGRGLQPCGACSPPAPPADAATEAVPLAAYRTMTPEEDAEQRRSFAYGNAKLANNDVTREMVSTPAPAPSAKEGEVRVLVACEFSGIVRDAFTALGHDATSCDLLPSERPGKHRQEDIRNVWLNPFDLMVAHPPCTHLAVSGARWFKEKRSEQEEALAFVRFLMDAPIPRICIENPVSVISSRIRKPDQIIQPWQFGHGETKATCLWLKGLQKLTPTNIVDGREARVHRMPPGPDRWRERSRTFPGIAAAMAAQWGAPPSAPAMRRGEGKGER